MTSRIPRCIPVSRYFSDSILVGGISGCRASPVLLLLSARLGCDPTFVLRVGRRLTPRRHGGRRLLWLLLLLLLLSAHAWADLVLGLYDKKHDFSRSGVAQCSAVYCSLDAAWQTDCQFTHPAAYVRAIKIFSLTCSSDLHVFCPMKDGYRGIVGTAQHYSREWFVRVLQLRVCSSSQLMKGPAAATPSPKVGLGKWESKYYNAYWLHTYIHCSQSYHRINTCSLLQTATISSVPAEIARLGGRNDIQGHSRYFVILVYQ